MGSVLPLLAALLARLGPSLAFTPNLFFNVSLDAIDPILVYAPEFFTPLRNQTTWNVTFSDSPWSSYTPGIVGQGNPLRSAKGTASMVTEGLTPEAVIEYIGTAIYCYGSTSDTYPPPEGVDSVWFTVDSQPHTNVTATSGLLASHQGEFGYHTAALSLIQGSWTLEGCDFTVGVEANVSRYQDLHNSSQYFVVSRDNQQFLGNDFYTYAGNWEIKTYIGGVGGQEPIVFPQAVTTSPGKVTAKVPDNTTFAVLVGTVGPSYGRGIVSWTPSPPLSQRSTVFLANSPWVSTALLHVMVLDPTIQYSADISALPAETTPNALEAVGLGLSRMDFYSSLKDGKLPNGTSTDKDNASSSAAGGSKLNTTAIIGGVVGGVGGIALAALIAGLVLWRRRKRNAAAKQRQVSSRESFVVDETPEVLPFAGAPARPESPANMRDVPPTDDGGRRMTMSTESSVFASRPDLLSSPPPSQKNGYEGMMAPAVLSPGLSTEASGSLYSDTLGAHAPPPASVAELKLMYAAEPSTPATATTETRFEQEQDAGAAPLQTNIELIPPSYDESWRHPMASSDTGSTPASPSSEGLPHGLHGPSASSPVRRTLPRPPNSASSFQ